MSRTPSYSHTIYTNSSGFRDRAAGPRALGPGPYVAWIGDSLTFGNGVEYDQTFVGVFDEAASLRGLASVNLAVGGHRLVDQEQVLAEFLDGAQARPGWVVIVLTAMGMATFEQVYDDVFVKNGYIFPAKGWLGPYLTITLGNSSSAYCFLRDGLRKAQARLLPGTVRKGLEPLAPLFQKGGPWAGAEVPGRLEARLTTLERRIRDAGAEPLYVYLPSSIDLHRQEFLAGRDAGDFDFERFARLLRGHCARAGLKFVDLLPLLQAHYDAGEHLGFSGDPHYNVETNRIIGLALRDALLTSGLLAAPSGRPQPGGGRP